MVIGPNCRPIRVCRFHLMLFAVATPAVKLGLNETPRLLVEEEGHDLAELWEAASTLHAFPEGSRT